MERDYDEQPPPEKLGRCARLGYMIKDELGEIPELFGSRYRRRTLGGLFVVIIALLTWWTITRYAPTFFFACHCSPRVPPCVQF